MELRGLTSCPASSAATRCVLREPAKPGVRADAGACSYGRRVAAHGLQGSRGRLNQIPLPRFERVEVLKEGASAIYGTGRISRLINLFYARITRASGHIRLSRCAERATHDLTGPRRSGYGTSLASFKIWEARQHTATSRTARRPADFRQHDFSNRGLSPDTAGHAVRVPSWGWRARRFPTTSVSDISSRQHHGARSGGSKRLDLRAPKAAASSTGRPLRCRALGGRDFAMVACAFDTGRAAVPAAAVENADSLGRAVFGAAGRSRV
jgi:iron complex outermembrane receptor protein